MAASLPNGIDVVVAFLGAMRAGLVWVGVNRVLAPPEKRYLLDDAGVSVFLGDVASVRDIERVRAARISESEHLALREPCLEELRATAAVADDRFLRRIPRRPLASLSFDLRQHAV